MNINELEKFLIGGFAQKRVINDELKLIHLDEVRQKNLKLEKI